MSDETANREEPDKTSQLQDNSATYLAIGVTFFILGITMSLYAFTGVSIAFFVLSFIEHDKKSKDQKKLDLGKSDTEQSVDDNPDTQR